MLHTKVVSLQDLFLAMQFSDNASKLGSHSAYPVGYMNTITRLLALNAATTDSLDKFRIYRWSATTLDSSLLHSSATTLVCSVSFILFSGWGRPHPDYYGTKRKHSLHGSKLTWELS